MEEESEKEKRLQSIALAYYSRPDIQKAIFDFCQNRETIARNFDSFSKRPDSLQYPTEVLQQVKKGFTSFHCSEEIWTDPLSLSTGLSPDKLNELRSGWDLLIDIDCKWFDYSKRACQAIIETLKHHNVKNFGVKYSGSKGFHIIVPWKAFPKEIHGEETKNLFPEVPRKIVAYMRFYAENILKESLPEDFYQQFKDIKIKKGIKCKTCKEICSNFTILNLFCKKCNRKEMKKITSEDEKKYKCPDCRLELEIADKKTFSECKKCSIDSLKNPDNFSSTIEVDLFDLMGLDIVLVSPRHLFRAPYSLHEKSLASVVLDPEEIENFHPKLADPFRIKIKNFYPEAIEGEARELVITALDFTKEKKRTEEKKDFQEIKIDRSKITHPPCINTILKGIADGRKRAVFILINYFRSLGFEFNEIEAILLEWNKLNKPPLKDGYILTQVSWYEKQKKMLPPNCDKDYYKGIGICNPDSLCQKVKNPVNYVVRKSFRRKK